MNKQVYEYYIENVFRKLVSQFFFNDDKQNVEFIIYRNKNFDSYRFKDKNDLKSKKSMKLKTHKNNLRNNVSTLRVGYDEDEFVMYSGGDLYFYVLYSYEVDDDDETFHFNFFFIFPLKLIGKNTFTNPYNIEYIEINDEEISDEIKSLGHVLPVDNGGSKHPSKDVHVVVGISYDKHDELYMYNGDMIKFHTFYKESLKGIIKLKVFQNAKILYQTNSGDYNLITDKELYQEGINVDENLDFLTDDDESLFRFKFI